MSTIGTLLRIVVAVFLAILLAAAILVVVGGRFLGPIFERNFQPFPWHEDIAGLAVLAALAFPFLFVIVMVGLSAFGRGARRSRGRGEELSPEDIRGIQELYRGFEKLSERVEMLETILLERSAKR